MSEQRQRIDDVQREKNQKLQQQEKKLDHTVRAFHTEEMLIRKKLSDDRQAIAPQLHDDYEEERIRKAVEDHQNSFVTFERLTKVKTDAITFLRQVITENAEGLAAQKEAWLSSIEEAKRRERKRRKEEYDTKKREDVARISEERKRIGEEATRTIESNNQYRAPPPIARLVTAPPSTIGRPDPEPSKRPRPLAAPIVGSGDAETNAPDVTAQPLRYVPPRMGGDQSSGRRLGGRDMGFTREVKGARDTQDPRESRENREPHDQQPPKSDQDSNWRSLKSTGVQ